MVLEIVLFLIALHGPDGREIDVSANEITSMHCKVPNVENKLFVEGTNAVISLTDGKNISVRETCSEIKAMLEQAK